jgi:hypothetical protein
MYEQLIDLAEWSTSKPTLVYCATIWCVPLTKTTSKYNRNVMDVDWGLVVKLALPATVTRRANKVIGIYDRSH